MAPKIYKDMAVKIDNATSAITEITQWVNNVNIQSPHGVIEYPGLSTEEVPVLPGLSRGRISMNGFVNSTTEGIFGPLVGNRTSIAKTIGLNNGIKWFNGEYYPENVQFSGAPDQMEMWSADFMLDGAITRTATAPS